MTEASRSMSRRRGVTRQTEKGVQVAVVQLLRAIRSQVYVLGTRRRRGEHQGTMQTPGLPDVIAFLPRALGVVFVEVKAPSGRLRPEQAAFRESCLALSYDGGSVYHVVGGVDALLPLLRGLNLVRPENIA
jgi:hypothetical protein